MHKTKILLSIFIFTLFVTSLNLVNTAQAQEAPLPGFNPNRLVEDSVFSDKTAMGSAEGIQKFLESKNSILANTSSDFVAKLREPTNSTLKVTLEDPRPSMDRLRTAAELIWDASQSSGINPQVIIVTLQKEQSLTTGHQGSSPERLQTALDYAMGFGCPDSGGCAGLYKGFYFQIFGNVDSENNRYLGAAKSLMRSFTTPGGRGPLYNGAVSKVGETIVLGNTLGGYSGVQAQQSVTLENSATAALYRYTPHVFNGNYNFWRYMNQWFRYPSGTIIASPNGQKFMIQNGSRMQINDFIARVRNVNTASPVLLSFNELESYPDGGLLGLADNTVAIAEGKVHVFLNNKKHPASEFILKQRGLSLNNAITASVADLAPYPDGPQLTPAEGSVLRGYNGPAVYVVENGQLRLVSALVFAQRNLASKIQLMPDSELATLPKGGFLAPANGTLIKSPSVQTVFLVVDRIKRPMTYLVFRTYNFKFSDVQTISDDEMLAMPIGNLAEPKDPTYYQVAGSGELYIYKNSSRHFLSSFVAKQRGITPDVTFSADEVKNWPEGDPIFPRDGTLIKADNSPAVYIIEKSQPVALSGADFAARKLSFKNVVTLPAAEVARYLGKGAGER
ncbi:hypothetical protein IPM19_03175 [bacterium]|nr:MAG: hypothetical protein IPM19_03175 [bacterium]